MDINKIISVYVKIRDEKLRISREADSKCADLQKKLDRLSAELQRYFIDTKTESVSSPAGTASRQQSIKFSVKNWDEYDAFLKREDVPPCDGYTKKVSTKFVKSYMKSNSGKLPDGVYAHREYGVNVTRGKD